MLKNRFHDDWPVKMVSICKWIFRHFHGAFPVKIIGIWKMFFFSNFSRWLFCGNRQHLKTNFLEILTTPVLWKSSSFENFISWNFRGARPVEIFSIRKLFISKLPRWSLVIWEFTVLVFLKFAWRPSHANCRHFKHWVFSKLSRFVACENCIHFKIHFLEVYATLVLWKLSTLKIHFFNFHDAENCLSRFFFHDATPVKIFSSSRIA